MVKTGNYCILCSANKENVIQRLSLPTLYKFPSSPSQKQKWIAILNLEDKKIPSRARVCELHFKASEFVRTRLRKEALPDNIYRSRKESLMMEHRGVGTTRSPLVEIKPRIINNDTNVQLVFLTSTRFVPVQPTDQRTNQLIPATIGNQDLNSSIEQASQSTVRVVPTSHRKCRRKVSLLKDELVRITEKSKQMIDIKLVFKDNPGFLEIVETQIRRYADKFSPYSTFEKTLALSLYYSCGRAGYRTLLSIGLKLPALSSIRRWMCEFKFSTGLNGQLFEILAALFKDKDSMGRDCVIVWDEMSIKEFVEYNKWGDMFEGIVDFGSHGRKLETAKEVLVFMVQGVSSRWKFPISFYYSSHATTSDTLNLLVKENLSQLFKIGLNVRLCICDMSFTNQGLYRAWKVSPDNPFIEVEGHQIVCIHDTPHLIKLIRNNLTKYDFVVKQLKKNRVVDTIVKWSHIVSFFRKDHRTVSRMAPKLTNLHIFLRDYSKMKVKLATQVLSYSVYAGIQTMCKRGILKKEAMDTATFIREIDFMFDFLNISKFSHDKPSRCAKTFFQNLGKLNRYAEFVAGITLKNDNNRNPEFLRGLLLNLRGIKLLATALKSEGYTCLYTRNFQQDSLENFFSVMRMKGGCSRNPTARQFRLNFKYLFFSMVMINPANGNTECLNTNFFKRFSKFKSALPLNKVGNLTPMNTTATMNPNQTTASDLNVSSLFYGFKAKRNLKLGDEQEECVAEYMGSACIHNVTKTTNCSLCKRMIIKGPTPGKSSTALVEAKAYGRGQVLHHLRDDVASVFKFINKMFPRYALETLNDSGSCIATGILQRYSNDDKVSEWLRDEACNGHRILILKYFVRAKIFLIVKDKNDTIKRPKAWEQSRREMRNQ